MASGQAEGQGTVGPGPWLKVEVRRIGGVGRSGIDYRHRGTPLLSLQDQAPLMDIGLGRIVAPKEDEATIEVWLRMVVTVRRRR